MRGFTVLTSTNVQKFVFCESSVMNSKSIVPLYKHSTKITTDVCIMYSYAYQ